MARGQAKSEMPWESQGADSSTTHTPIQGSAEGLIRLGTREGSHQCRNQKETRKGVRQGGGGKPVAF